MRSFLFLALSALCALAAPAQSKSSETSSSALSMEFTGGRWFDGKDFNRETWYSADGKLTRQKPYLVNMRVDLAGRYVIPPFAEAHNHDLQNPSMAPISAPRYLREGIFYSAQMCADTAGISGLRRLLNQPNTVDVIYAEGCITASDGHPLGIALRMDKAAGHDSKPEDYLNKMMWAVDNMVDLDARWPKITETGTKLIKIILINSENYTANRKRPELFGANGLDPTLVPEIVKRAHEAGIRVAAHVETASDFATAVKGGVDLVVHLTGYRFTTDKTATDYRISDDAIAEAARRGIIVVPTAVASRHHQKLRPEVAGELRQMQAENLRRLIDGGVKLATGSDLVMTGSVLDEIEYLDELAVMPRAQLLSIATMDTPKVLFLDRKIGVFEEGAEASLIVLDGNPLKDIKAIRSIWLRIKQGNILVPAPAAEAASD